MGACIWRVFEMNHLNVCVRIWQILFRGVFPNSHLAALARGPQAAQQQQRSAQKIVRHSPRCPTYSRISTERREDIHIKRRDVEVRGAVKPARAIARGQASPAGLSRCADLENELQHHQRWHAVPNTVNSTSLFGVTWLVLSTKRCSPNR